MNMDIDKIREFFGTDRFAMGIGCVINEASDHRSVVSIELTDFHRNGNNAIQGGVMFTLADFSCAIASSCDGTLCVSADGHISYLHPPKGTKLISEANCIKSGRTLSYYEAMITDDIGTKVAKGTFTMFRVRDNW